LKRSQGCLDRRFNVVVVFLGLSMWLPVMLKPEQGQYHQHRLDPPAGLIARPTAVLQRQQACGDRPHQRSAAGLEMFGDPPVR